MSVANRFDERSWYALGLSRDQVAFLRNLNINSGGESATSTSTSVSASITEINNTIEVLQEQVTNNVSSDASVATLDTIEDLRDLFFSLTTELNRLTGRVQELEDA